jgi:hypothetical protein
MKWIKTSERLPEIDKPILIFYGTSNIFPCYVRLGAFINPTKVPKFDLEDYPFLKKGDKYQWVVFDTNGNFLYPNEHSFPNYEETFYLFNEFTYWMPLPEPPENL